MNNLIHGGNNRGNFSRQRLKNKVLFGLYDGYMAD